MSKLEEDLKVSSVEVEKIKVEADAQATIVGAEKEKVDAQASIAAVESAKCAVIAEQVDAKMKSVQADLDQALPLVAKAETALARLNLKDFQQLKAFNNPQGVCRVNRYYVMETWKVFRQSPNKPFWSH